MKRKCFSMIKYRIYINHIHECFLVHEFMNKIYMKNRFLAGHFTPQVSDILSC